MRHYFEFIEDYIVYEPKIITNTCIVFIFSRICGFAIFYKVQNLRIINFDNK